MQEIISLSMVIRRLESARVSATASGLTFCRFVMFAKEETIETDRLLVSEEAVRVLDSGN